jgi:hypothetical protein
MRTRHLYFTSLVKSSFRFSFSHFRFCEQSIPYLCSDMDSSNFFALSSSPIFIAFSFFLQGMEVQVLDLSSDSEGEVSAHSPDHKRPSQQPGVDPNRRVGDNGSSAVDSLFEEAGAARPPRHPSDALNKGKEKVVDVESVESPKHGGESLGAAGRVLGAGSDPWSALVSKCKAGDSGNNGTECWDSWGDWGDQLTNSAPVARLGSERTGFHETYELRGTHQLHSDSSAFSDQWKGILGASPADPVNSLWYSRDTSMKDSEDETLSQRSVSVREISSCDYFLTEDSSSSWLSKVKGLNFPLPDEHQLRTRQIENDEMFARRLQEQLNQQQPGSQHSEAVVTLDYSSLNVLFPFGVFSILIGFAVCVYVGM